MVSLVPLFVCLMTWRAVLTREDAESSFSLFHGNSNG
jgi:hypothetical protein